MNMKVFYDYDLVVVSLVVLVEVEPLHLVPHHNKNERNIYNLHFADFANPKCHLR